MKFWKFHLQWKQDKILKNKFNKKKYKNYTLKNHKTEKEVQDLNEHKNILCLQIRRLSIVKIPRLLKLIYRVNAIPIRIPVGFFAETDKLILKSILNLKKHRRAKKLWEKGTNRGDSLSDSKLNNKAIVMSTRYITSTVIIQITWTEFRVQKRIYVSNFLRRMLQPFNGQTIVFSTNGENRTTG